VTDTKRVPTGIAPLDARVGGVSGGGSYIVLGPPGPEKMVAALQFVHEGARRGERCLLVTNADGDDILDVADAWGMSMRDAWREGRLQVIGFKDDFELRAIRSIEPEEVVEELDSLMAPGLKRIAVDPGAMFLSGGAKTLLGSTFLGWARDHPATVLTTFSVDGGARALPSSGDWLIHATTGRLLLESRHDGLRQITVSTSMPGAGEGEGEPTVTLELRPGEGLVEPKQYPARRGADRGEIDENRLLLVSLGDSHASDLEVWATRAFETDVVSEPFEAVAKVQGGTKYGGVLIHAPRRQIRQATQACMALRPLTRAAIVFASDDAVRSTDRIHILEAGADDCLSGGLDFRELALRIRQSVATGARPVPAGVSGDANSAAPGPAVEEREGGRVSREAFVDEIHRRAASPSLAFFCVLEVTSSVLSPHELVDSLAEQVRAEEGDLVSSVSGRCAVLLQGAREGQLGPFLARLRSRLAERSGRRPEAAGFDIEVLSHPADADRIMALLGASGAGAR